MNSIDDIMRLGEVFAQSEYFLDATDAAKAIVKILAGQELGLGAMASMAGISIIKGKVTLGANLMAGVIKSQEKYDYKVIEHTIQICSIEYFQYGESIGISEFTIEHAKQAKLLGKDNWKNYPRNMLFARAMSNGAKWFCPDAFSGHTIYVPEELEIPTYNNEAVKNYLITLDNALPLPSKFSEVIAAIERGELEYDGKVTIGQIAEWSEV